MIDHYASFKNKTTIGKILGNMEYEVLILSFLKNFLDIDLKTYSTSELSDAIFITKGAFSNDFQILGTDNNGIKQLINIRFLEMHPGLTNAYMDASNGRWDSLKRHTQSNGFIHSNCQVIREICFFYFNFSETNNYHTFKKYNFDELPKTIQFDCFELHKFNKKESELNNELDIWLFAIKNGGQSIQNLENSNFTKILKKALNRKYWDKRANENYERYEAYNKERSDSMLKRYKEFNYNLNEKYINEPTKNAELNWVYLEKQMDILPKNKVKKSQINITSLKSILPKLAFDLFRKWTIVCQKKYPHIDLTIINEQVLIKDIEDIVRKSIIALFNDNDFYFKNMSKSYALNFILGYIEGSIGAHWYMEYIIKTKNEYKTTVALQSLNIYLQTEDVMRLQLEHIYQEIMKNKVNLLNPDLDIAKIDLKSEYGKIIEPNNATTVIQTVLTNLTNEYIAKISKIEVENFELGISDFIDEDKIRIFIEENWQLF
jgi:hypothetical protein